MDYSDFLTSFNIFAEKINKSIFDKELHIKPHWSIDHICYRVEQKSQYLMLKQDFTRFADLLIESNINGRPISTFKLNSPLKVNNFTVDLLELPAPKEVQSYKEGFEHCEIVVDENLEDLKSKHSNKVTNSNGMSKGFNPELGIKLDSGLSVKLHNLSLESVVNLEKNNKVFEAIKKSKILNIFKENNPLVVGTFPLSLQTQDSDIDIILEAQCFDSLEESLISTYSNAKGFKLEVNGCDYLLANFYIDEILFEIYASHEPSIKQRAFRHFNLQERILKLGSDSFKEDILTLRKSGLKTEPAFAKLLNLNGNSYHELLNLYEYPEAKLKELIY